jgi:hypothetical protein
MAEGGDYGVGVIGPTISADAGVFAYGGVEPVGADLRERTSSACIYVKIQVRI